MGGVLLLVGDAVLQGLNHYQTLAFIRAGSPEFYALLSGQPFAITLAIVALAFIVVGCIGIWKQRRIPASPLRSHDTAHHVMRSQWGGDRPTFR
jgi:predicted small integral membrane protein